MAESSSQAFTQDFSGAHGTEEHAQRGYDDGEAHARQGRIARVVLIAFSQSLSTEEDLA